jgi:hypothetical protein
MGLSLWDPAPACDWLADAGTEPDLSLLPARALPQPLSEITQEAIDQAANEMLPGGAPDYSNRKVYTPASAVLHDALGDNCPQSSPFFNSNRASLIDLALKYKLPAIYETGEYVRDGGLLAYGPNFSELFRRVASYVHRILVGAKPGDLPVEQPTKFELSINLKTARAISLTVPEPFLLRADDIVE